MKGEGEEGEMKANDETSDELQTGASADREQGQIKTDASERAREQNNPLIVQTTTFSCSNTKKRPS